jgi:superfamily II DNA or RNA helicase
MPVDWSFCDKIQLQGIGTHQIEEDDARRQQVTAESILSDLNHRPGVVLADEVGMGKTYVALAVAASVLARTRGRGGPVVIMVPSRLRRKWQREWEQFKHHCTQKGSLDWVRAKYAHNPTKFFRLRDDRGEQRCHLVFMTTGCFSLGLQDPWIKLAFIRIARRHTKLSAQQKSRIGRWAANLVRQVTSQKLTSAVVEELMIKPLASWKGVLVNHAILSDEDDDPIPELLSRYEQQDQHHLDWKPLCEFLRNSLPVKDSIHIDERLKKARKEFNEICRSIYEQWLVSVPWKAPLLILDEAHHAKNDTTRLAKMFRNESEIPFLRGKFSRMLFLTATPFQLGHHELIRVLQTFGAVRWNGERAPAGSDNDFQQQIDQLADALDKNRLAGKNLDQLWGQVTPEMLGDVSVEQWWKKIQAGPRDTGEQRLFDAVDRCQQTRDAAQILLRPWVIRHNRSPEFPPVQGAPAVSRRESHSGRSMIDSTPPEREEGIPIADDAVLPFLLSARAQGDLASRSGARAFFAEGLSSSYEAFHHTRDARGNARDTDDDGLPVPKVPDAQDVKQESSTEWYETQVAALIPSKAADRRKRLMHPKVAATVLKAVDLWLDGEKVLVFCVYRETARALYEHLRSEVEDRIIKLAGEKLGLDLITDRQEIETQLDRIGRRLSDEGRPFNVEIREILAEPFKEGRFAGLLNFQSKLIEVMTAYIRSPSFIARYLPIDDPDLKDAFERGEGRAEIIIRGRKALRRLLQESMDSSGQTLIERFVEFLSFAAEQAERAQTQIELTAHEQDDEPKQPLLELLQWVSDYSRSRRRIDSENDDLPDDGDDGSYRVTPLVRMVYGDTPPETRDRLAQAFNSPLFPEILVSSSVMGEGIDLHRFCRHVIHHDGFWNPSALEQQTGRLDRIRSKAEVNRRPIWIGQPFIAGGADEKMYRVLRDRERWFQVVMGQKFEFDEAASEALAQRVPLPDELAKQLTFDLTRWKNPS